MEILGFKEEPKYPENTLICSHCNCIFTYDEDKDVEHETKSGVDYFGAWWETTYWTKCPNCKKNVFVKKEEYSR